MNDVTSPIDLRNYDDAVEWQDTANVKRPWRKDFFDYYANLIKTYASDQGHILELGAGPGFLAQHLLSQLPNIQYTAFDFSEAMHQLAQQKLTPSERARANYFIRNLGLTHKSKKIMHYSPENSITISGFLSCSRI